MQVKKNFLPAAAFCLFLMLADLGPLIFNMLHLPMRFRTVIFHQFIDVIPHLLPHVAGLLAIYVIFFAALWSLEGIFRVKVKWPLYLLISLYILFYCVLHAPQTFGEFDVLTVPLKWLVPRLHVDFIYFVAGGILLFLMWSLWQAKNRTRSQLIAGLVVTTFLSWFFFDLQALNASPSTSRATPPPVSKAKASRRPNIIMISVDSLNEDAFTRVNGNSDRLERFLNTSFRFDRVITSSASTHASFSSLFTGRQSARIDARHFLPKSSRDTDQFLRNSLIRAFRDQGYRNVMMIDDRSYSDFQAGETFERSLGPRPGIVETLLPSFLRSRLVFGLFNNALGHLLIPDFGMNAAVRPYRLSYFTDNVIKQVRDLSASSDSAPFFFIAHTCALHWPAEFPYPFYPRDGYDDVSKTQYSYSDRFRPFEWTFGAKERRKRVAFNFNLYLSGVKMVQEQFLDPILAEIESRGLLENSVVILMSDHGESFWLSPGNHPRAVLPAHGSSLVFGAGSERTFFAMHVPGETGVKIPTNVGLIDVLPTLGELAAVPLPQGDGQSFAPILKNPQAAKDWRHLYYTETALWPGRLFNGQTRFIDFMNIPLMFQFEKTRGLVYFDEKYEGAAIAQKQRAIYDGDKMLVVYPTHYGFFSFLCHLSSDPFCLRNQTKEFAQTKKQLLTEMARVTETDQARGFFPNFNNRVTKLGEPLTWSLEPDASPWLEYQFTMEQTFHLHHFEEGVRRLESLIARAAVPWNIKTLARSALLSLCAGGKIAPDNTPAALAELFKESKYLMELQGGLEPSHLFRCAANLKKTDWVNQLNRDARTKKTLYQHSVFSEDLALNTLQKRLESSYYGPYGQYQSLLYWLAIEPDEDKIEGIMRKLKANPNYDDEDKRLLLANLIRSRRTDFTLLANEAREIFRTEFEYHLIGELSDFYNILFVGMMAHNKTEALSQVRKQLANDQLPANYFFRAERALAQHKPSD